MKILSHTLVVAILLAGSSEYAFAEGTSSSASIEAFGNCLDTKLEAGNEKGNLEELRECFPENNSDQYAFIYEELTRMPGSECFLEPKGLWLPTPAELFRKKIATQW